VDLETGVIVGAEALIRWNHPTRGVVYPGEFLALAEEGGILPTIGRWVLETGIGDLSRWIRRSLVHDAFTLDVNVSASELRPELVSEIAAILAKADVPATRLQLEVPESAALRASKVITQLRDAGVAVALDDIGAGAASLGHMVKLKVDAIKIDRLFVGGLGSVSRDTAIVEAIQLMSNRLELLTIAEGIETEDQLRRLLAVGCGLGQGYLFGKPCARTAFQKILEQRVLWPAGERTVAGPMGG
jgi:EAL domain-containing protein (putative c-di-GMP-specific phosphodiesterase class I)